MAVYCAAMAHRIVELLNHLGMGKEFAITGGIAKNEGVVKCLENEIGIKTMEKIWHNPEYRSRNYPLDTQIIGALGAALFANAPLERRKVKSARKQ